MSDVAPAGGLTIVARALRVGAAATLLGGTVYILKQLYDQRRVQCVSWRFQGSDCKGG